MVTVAWPTGLDLGTAIIVSCPSGCQRSPLQQDAVRAVVQWPEPKTASSLRTPEEAWLGC